MLEAGCSDLDGIRPAVKIGREIRPIHPRLEGCHRDAGPGLDRDQSALNDCSSLVCDRATDSTGVALECSAIDDLRLQVTAALFTDGVEELGNQFQRIGIVRQVRRAKDLDGAIQVGHRLTLHLQAGTGGHILHARVGHHLVRAQLEALAQRIAQRVEVDSRGRERLTCLRLRCRKHIACRGPLADCGLHLRFRSGEVVD